MISNRVLYSYSGPGLRKVIGSDGPLVAIKVTLMPNGILGFLTPNADPWGRPHMLNGHLEEETDDGFDWHWVIPPWEDDLEEDYGILKFRVVRLKQYYEELVPAQVVTNPPLFRTDEELWDYYWRTWG